MTKPNIQKAALILNAGGLVAFPTETVYGLGGDAENPQAIEKIFASKERPSTHPLIVHIATIDAMQHWAIDIPAVAYQLAEAFWPGPLTLILKKAPQVLFSVTGGQDTIGLRIPNHPVALALLNAFGRGIAAPSANKFTHISPTTAAAVAAELGNKVDLILDGGDCQVGLESTIIDLSQTEYKILRPGMLAAKEIASVLKQPISFTTKTSVRVPGMHELHYAPRTKTICLTSDEIINFIETLSADKFPVALITHHAMQHPKINLVTLSDNPHEYAHDLYATLRKLDEEHFNYILIEAVPASEAWDAIRDRINKASLTIPITPQDGML